jgi:hypothetical protein
MGKAKINRRQVDYDGQPLQCKPSEHEEKNKHKGAPYYFVFDSVFEWKVYKILEESGIDFTFKPDPIVYIPAFETMELGHTKENRKRLRQHILEGSNKTERSSNKRNFNASNNMALVEAKVREATWAPDFLIGEDLYVEAKGFPNDAFPIKFKMCKYILQQEGKYAILVQTQKQVRDLVKFLLENEAK